ncbi:acetyl-CoA synthetase-like protein [Mytilinidion resinicola]|uniref:Acetyl-CoA synthetase-like protein n=1 Tax=Mytilinidion resinicola TaxID=574789 RepID=A0A6A6XZT9_9PEZI|nr:acetyl-CoA synthetase-like protein [Mytilinidion resinicola]KAF2801485.1 acetyl-CoA synthetase-like protein [Mytilinidion resinicola]
MVDRTHFVPKHTGCSILPCTPLFSRLLRFAHQHPPRPCIHDVRTSQTRTHIDLLTDVLALRVVIYDALPPSAIAALHRQEEIYIAVIAAGGYEYAVAVLAILAICAAAVPITPALPVDEAVYFIQKSRAALILTSMPENSKGEALESRIRATAPTSARPNPQDFTHLSIGPVLMNKALKPEDILVSSNRYLDENAPAIVIFTSGTTGPPKGAVMRRAYVSDHALAVADHYALTPNDRILHVLPVHHATGVGISFFPFLIAGAAIEFRSGSFDERWMWERWRAGVDDQDSSAPRLTFFSGVPTIYMRMRRYYQLHLSKRPRKEVMRYEAGAKQFRACLCGTSALPRPLEEFWRGLLGKRILQRYGATEFGAVFKAGLEDGDVPEGSVGETEPGVEIKLGGSGNAEEGEVLVKSPHMFSKYLHDPEATAKAHDEDGFFRTGDIARRTGKYYHILGRASLDIIKSGGYKISALDIEREIIALPYIAEVMIVGVADEEFGQRVAALVSLRDEELTPSYFQSHGNERFALTIEDLRRELRHRLSGYKMPTLLRIVEGELPKTVTGKVQKNVLGPRFFPGDWGSCGDVQRWEGKTDVVARL